MFENYRVFDIKRKERKAMKTKTETLKLKIDELCPENFTGIVEYPLGTKIWFQDGFPHRVDGPAIEQANGDKEWWIDGKCHKLDGPAIEYANGIKQWWIEGSFYHSMILKMLFKDSIFLGKEKGKYDLYWLKFLTVNQGIQEFPYIKGMETERLFFSLLKEFLTEKEMKEIGL